MKIQLTEATPCLFSTWRQRHGINSRSGKYRTVWLSFSTRFNSHHLIHLLAVYLPLAIRPSINQHSALDRAERYGPFLPSYRLGLHLRDDEEVWKIECWRGAEEKKKKRKGIDRCRENILKWKGKKNVQGPESVALHKKKIKQCISKWIWIIYSECTICKDLNANSAIIVLSPLLICYSNDVTANIVPLIPRI